MPQQMNELKDCPTPTKNMGKQTPAIMISITTTLREQKIQFLFGYYVNSIHQFYLIIMRIYPPTGDVKSTQQIIYNITDPAQKNNKLQHLKSVQRRKPKKKKKG